MKTKIGIIKGATKKEVLDKKFNIYLGISLGNKWFNKKNIKESIKWGLEHTKNKFCVQIADTLQSINYEIRDNYSKQSAITKALKEGDKFVELVTDILKELPEKDRKRIDIIRWDEIKKDKSYQKLFSFFVNEFNNNPDFKKEIKKIVRDFYVNRLKREPNEKKIERLSYYVLDELPELLKGFEYKGIRYNCWIYPEYVELHDLIYDLQEGKKFPEIVSKIKDVKNVFIELKVIN